MIQNLLDEFDDMFITMWLRMCYRELSLLTVRLCVHQSCVKDFKRSTPDSGAKKRPTSQKCYR